MVAIVLAVIVALAAAGGGVTYAADGAAPGDPLYGIDRAAEQTRLSLTASPAQAVRLQLAFADERLGEAEELAEADDGTNLSAAVNGYGDAVAAAAQELGQTRDRDQDQLRTLFDDSLGTQQGRLERVLTSNAYAFGRGSGVVDDDDDEDDADEEDADDEDDTGDEDDVDETDDTELDDETEDTFTAACVGANPHPVGSSLAAQYDVPYETVMTWFCDDGFGFGEIMIALRVGDAVGEEPADLLTQSVEMDGWGHVLQSLGLIGHGQGNPHRPDLDEPTEEPTDEPTDEPTVEPTDEPTAEPTDERPCGDTPGQGCGVGNDGVPPGQSDDKPGNGNGNDTDHVPPGQSDDQPGNGNGNDTDHVPPGQSDDKPGNGVGNGGTPPGQSEDHPGNGRGNNK